MDSLGECVAETLEELRRQSSAKVLGEMGPRYGIHTAQAFGVPMAQMKLIAVTPTMTPKHAGSEDFGHGVGARNPRRVGIGGSGARRWCTKSSDPA